LAYIYFDCTVEQTHKFTVSIHQYASLSSFWTPSYGYLKCQ